jgi:hypothetical protein
MNKENKPKYYVRRSFEKPVEPEPIYREDGTVLAWRLQTSMSMRIHEIVYNQMADEQKGDWIEDSTDN